MIGNKPHTNKNGKCHRAEMFRLEFLWFYPARVCAFAGITANQISFGGLHCSKNRHLRYQSYQSKS